jgi:hypothetical protein
LRKIKKSHNAAVFKTPTDFQTLLYRMRIVSI